jgi:hypothetical protein
LIPAVLAAGVHFAMRLACCSWAVCLVSFVQHWTFADAWGIIAHERIAKIAEHLLKGKRKDQVRALLHGDLLDFADWEKKMTNRHPETNVLHFHHQEPEWNCMSTLGDQEHLRCDHENSADKGSLFCALAFFFEHFVHDALLREFPQPREPINTPSHLPTLEKVTSMELTPAHYLRWLVVLIGDLHQPLHWLKQHDYGRGITVVYKDRHYKLLEFWEDELPKHLPDIPDVKRLQDQYEEREHAWGHKLPTELFRHWATETAEVVCSQVYQHMEVNHADGTRKIDDPYHLDDEVLQRWAKIASDFTTLAGERLAFVLLDILEHNRHKAAHREGRGRHHRKRRHFRNFGMNFCVAAALVPALVACLRWHETNGSKMSLMQLLGMDKRKATV